MNETQESLGERSSVRRSCTLMVTHQCNLNCTYCYESYKSDKQMPLELAKSLVEKEFEFVATQNQFKEIVFDFIGGEPLVCFAMIAELAEWMWSISRPVPYVLFATTNGTLLDNDRKAWFEKHKHQFCLGLSLDGPLETQEINRRGSFSKIDLNFFQQLWPEQGVKMTLSRETLPTLAEDVIYLQELGFEASFNPAVGIDWTEQDADIYEQQLDLLAKYYMDQDGSVTPAHAFTLDFAPLLPENYKPHKYCGTGTNMVTYDVDSNAYPCHMFTPIVLGENRSEDIKRFDFYAPEGLIDDMCRECPLIMMCPTCYGLNYKFRNDIALRDPATCRMFKRQILVAHRYQLDLLTRNGIPTSSEDLSKAKVLINANDILENAIMTFSHK
ncbi:radical SAM protein with 4Fe4S-binding SPASM domain [Sporomusa sp. KB1]|nr:radical SAM protein with 4Fe4S-binding SPASM domain [Sporomusa sp. KB1]